MDQVYLPQSHHFTCWQQLKYPTKVVGRGYFSHTSSYSKKVASARRVQLNRKCGCKLIIMLCKGLPSWTEISPMAHVALLHTEMNSGLRFWPRIGKKSPGIKRNTHIVNFCFICLQNQLPTSSSGCSASAWLYWQ